MMTKFYFILSSIILSQQLVLGAPVPAPVISDQDGAQAIADAGTF